MSVAPGEVAPGGSPGGMSQAPGPGVLLVLLLVQRAPGSP